jgi:hypothetical protein
LLQVKFKTKTKYILQKHIGLILPTDHLTQCTTTWSLVPKHEWTHLFVHTLDTIPKNWYIELEVCRGITDWEELTCNFKVTFSFENDAPLVDTTMKMIKNKILTYEDSIKPLPLCSAAKSSATVHEVLECYNIVGED